MIQPARPDHATEPKPPPEPHPKTLAEQKADFTAEGAPPPDPSLPAAGQPATPKKTMPQTTAPHAGPLARALSGARR